MIRIAKTENGLVRGLPAPDPRITAFKGIPFAAPPVYENRWRAPMPCKDWDGVLDAYKFKPIPVQDTPGIGDDLYCREWHVDPDIEMDEDCLYLNIWTNAKSDESRLPVLVWFFGGALQWGYTSEMEMDGERIARRGIVVVTVSYRLNVFGFMTHPELMVQQPDAPANFGSLDQQAGLKWVKRNIQAFGGDPGNITIAGQSAGGGSVLSQMVCKENKGLFQKAVIMSGMIGNPYEREFVFSPESMESAQKNGKKFLEFAGAENISQARMMDARYLSMKYAEYVKENPRMFTVRDQRFLDGDPLELIAMDKHINVPIMAGNTRDEFLNVINASTEKELKEKAEMIFGSNTEEFLGFEESHVFRDGGYAPVNGIECAVKGTFLKNRENGNNENCYYYCFDENLPGWDNPGSFHSSDLWFFFETLAKCWRPFTGKHYDLARKMCDYLCNFIKSGDPNGTGTDGEELPEWKPYTKDCAYEMVFNSDGIKTNSGTETPFIDFMIKHTGNRGAGKNKEAFNPYLPSWEYVPDGEPYVFDGRVYVYGSHDQFNGDVFCQGDYVCWSAPVDNPGDWRYEGVIYKKTDDPANPDGSMCLYAPDITIGHDGRYYLYYVLDKLQIVSVAVCDTPAGNYKFYGNVHYQDGVLLGEREGDQPQFDPGVLYEDGKVYLYTGFCGKGDKSRKGASVTVLGGDMLTVIQDPVVIVPGSEYSSGTEYECHAFFEASSIRKINNKYYFIYSSEVMHELCYAVSEKPDSGFKYAGVLVSNCDLHIDTYKPAEMVAVYGGNNHGSIVQIGEAWYIFYHRQTNGTWYSRQGCAERLEMDGNGMFRQAELTSCGLNGKPLEGRGVHPAYIACNLFTRAMHQTYTASYKLTDRPLIYSGDDSSSPVIVQDGSDGDMEDGYIANIRNTATAGFKYFNCQGISEIKIWTRGYFKGVFEVRTAWDGECLAEIPIEFSNIWTEFSAKAEIPDGEWPVYLTFRGEGNGSLKAFGLY